MAMAIENDLTCRLRDESDTHKKGNRNKEISYIPGKLPEFIETETYNRLISIFKWNKFVTVYVTGLSGVGKTVEIEQVASTMKRDLLRINFTEETSERHIIGGWRLEDGNTIWEDGPALIAMKRGAILLLDEVDLASPKVLCLQPILEGSAYINKQTGEVVNAKAGFAIIATGNTKGQLSGRNTKFVGAKAQNEAFLDRFDFTIDHNYPNKSTEMQILSAFAVSLGVPTSWDVSSQEARLPWVLHQFIDNLTTWAANIREVYERGTVPEVISTRRLKSAIKSWIIFKDTKLALLDVVSRFPDDTKTVFIQLYATLEKASA